MRDDASPSVEQLQAELTELRRLREAEVAALRAELNSRTSERDAAQEQQATTAEVLRVIASSPTDRQTVLEAIASAAARLTESDGAGVLERVGERLTSAATYGGTVTAVDALRASNPNGWSGHALALNTVVNHAYRSRRTIHVPDMEIATQDEFPDSRPLYRIMGNRSQVVAPLLREGEPIGILTVQRFTLRPFTPQQVSLIESFADQAVIAIENARLFSELQESNRQVTEALEQQTALAEVLGIIAASPTDARPVLEAVMHSAIRLSGSRGATLWSLEDGVLQVRANIAGPRAPGDRLAVDARHPVAQALRGRRTVYVADRAAPEAIATYPDAIAHSASASISVPLLRENESIGVLTLLRDRDRPHSPREIVLIEAFANQAVIAIENARLFSELEQRNRALNEALEQQTATAEVLRVIASSPTDLQTVLDTLIASATRLCKAESGTIHQLDGDRPKPVAFSSEEFRRTILERVPEGGGPPLTRESFTGRVILDRRTLHVPDVEAAVLSEFPDSRRTVLWVQHRSLISTPLMRNGAPIGVMSLHVHSEARPFTEQQIALLETFADQAVIAIENARLFSELEQRNHALNEALSQRTATAEILRVIAASPTDLTTVLDTIVASAVRLGDAGSSQIWRVDGDVLRCVAHRITYPDTFDPQVGRSLPITPHTMTGRTVLAGLVIHIADVNRDEVRREFPESAPYTVSGPMTRLHVPLLRDGVGIGMLGVSRLEVRPFTEAQIALLEAFADQAVIAIENARLFSELEQRNADLSEALEQQTVTAEVFACHRLVLN